MNLAELLKLAVTDYTLRTVLLGAAVLGLTSGALSTFAVLRKQSLLGDAMSHAALPGVVLAFIITGQKTPIVLISGALIAGWIGSLLALTITSQTRLKQDSALGVVLAVFFGFGIMLMSWLQGQNIANQSGLDKFLFGRAAALVERDVVTMATFGIIVLSLVFLFWKEFKLISFDIDFANALGFRARWIDILLTTLIVIAVVIGLQMVGVVLMSAMLVAPGAAARQWTDRLDRMVMLSATFGAVAGMAGAMASSLVSGLPTGPAIVVAVTIIVAFSLLFAPKRGVVWDWVRQQRNARRLRTAAVLEIIYKLALSHGDPLHPHPQGAFATVLKVSNAGPVLNRLEAQELVLKSGADNWQLTEAGIAYIEVLLGKNVSEGSERQ